MQQHGYGSSSWSNHVVWGAIDSSSGSQSSSDKPDVSDKPFGGILLLNPDEESSGSDGPVGRAAMASERDREDDKNEALWTFHRDTLPESTLKDLQRVEAFMKEQSHPCHEVTGPIETDLSTFRQFSEEDLRTILPTHPEYPTSLGSYQHALGTCIPCSYHARTKGCQDDVYCGFCHFHGSREARKRNKSKSTKAKRELRERIEAEGGSVKPLISSSVHAFTDETQQILLAKLKTLKELQATSKATKLSL